MLYPFPLQLSSISFSLSFSSDLEPVAESLTQEAKPAMPAVKTKKTAWAGWVWTFWQSGLLSTEKWNHKGCSGCNATHSAVLIKVSAQATVIMICLHFIFFFFTLNLVTFTGVGGQTSASHTFLYILHFIPLSPAQSPFAHLCLLSRACA